LGKHLETNKAQQVAHAPFHQSGACSLEYRCTQHSVVCFLDLSANQFSLNKKQLAVQIGPSSKGSTFHICSNKPKTASELNLFAFASVLLNSIPKNSFTISNTTTSLSLLSQTISTANPDSPKLLLHSKS
jgi:hypothetical protein